MGRNLLLNMADQKFAVAGLDLDEEKFFTHTRSESTTPKRPP
jgi:6-phosphogluconate dehydrogenase